MTVHERERTTTLGVLLVHGGAVAMLWASCGAWWAGAIAMALGFGQVLGVQMTAASRAASSRTQVQQERDALAAQAALLAQRAEALGAITNAVGRSIADAVVAAVARRQETGH